MWDNRCALIRHRISVGKAYSADDFAPMLDGLDEELINDDAFAEAVNYGRKAIDGVPRDDTDPVIEAWIGHLRPYAQKVPARLADDIATALPDPDDDDVDLDDVLAALDAKLDALRSSVTRYAEPIWGAGNNGYGAQLQSRNILMDWDLDDGANHCEDCPALADGSPYEHLPTWPGLGSTQCLDRCKCRVVANEASWAESMGEAA